MTGPWACGARARDSRWGVRRSTVNKRELEELIVNGENSGVEFKRDDLEPAQLAREVVALANLQGGRILLGVEDDGTISGVRRNDLKQWVMDAVFGQAVHPLILPFYEEVVIDERRVAVVTVPPRLDRLRGSRGRRLR